MAKNNLRLFLGLIIIAFILSMWTVSAASNLTSLNSNETNGSTWYKGGTIRMFNFTLLITNINTTTNLTQINFSAPSFILVTNGTNVTVASSASSVWTCTNNTANTLINCTGQAAQPSFAINVTINATLPSTPTQINQTWNISTLDNYSALNWTSWNTEVDNVAPTITLPFYTNATVKTNSSNLTLNISVNDAGSGLIGSACMINANGTNQTVAVSNGWCNSTPISLINLVNGNQTINLYVNDTVNNLGLNNSFVISINSTINSNSSTCISNWTTTNWSTCINGIQTRNVTDANNCNNNSLAPVNSQSCQVICTPNWSCTDFTPTICPQNGTQKRSCIDTNNCNNNSGKPAETNICSPQVTSNTNWFFIIIVIIVIGLIAGVGVWLYFLMRKNSLNNQDLNNQDNQGNQGNSINNLYK